MRKTNTLPNAHFRTYHVVKNLIGFRLLVLLCFGSTTVLHAETPILERIVSLNLNDRRLPDALIDLSRTANFYFSYNSNILNAEKKVSVSAQNETVRAVLRRLLGDGFQFKEKGNFLIIQKLKTDERLIGGYISDKKTGQGVANATVYDKKTLKSATTNQYGYYEIVSREPIKELSVAKFDYTDTVFQVKSLAEAPPQYIDASLFPTAKIEPPKPVKVKVDISTKDDSDEGDSYRGFAEQTLLQNVDIQRFITNYSNGFQRVDALNVTNDLRRRTQWSVVPYLGNNGGLSGAIVNDYSLNLTVGYSKGNRVLEVAGIGNINRKNVSGIQLAPVFNIVGGKMSGLQVAGLLNRTDALTGLQIAGLTNSNNDILRGGFQIAGINNSSKNGHGGFQISTIVNKTKRGKVGGQLAGIANVADTVGFQFGLINSATHLRGFQIGLINVNDTLSGVVLGLINVIKKGYNAAEINTFDGKFTRVAFKTGTKSFYTNYVASIKTDSQTLKTPLWSLGIGLGGGVRLARPLRLTTDFTIESMNNGQITEGVFRSRLFRIAPAFDIKIGRHISLALGGHWSAYTADKTRLGVEKAADFQQKIVPANAKTMGDFQTWWGWSAGLRFF
jgi:hypothetical protein